LSEHQLIHHCHCDTCGDCGEGVETAIDGLPHVNGQGPGEGGTWRLAQQFIAMTSASVEPIVRAMHASIPTDTPLLMGMAAMRILRARGLRGLDPDVRASILVLEQQIDQFEQVEEPSPSNSIQ